jgi:hypothetical protein
MAWRSLELMDLYFNLKAPEFAPWLDSAIAAGDVHRYIIDTAC